MGPVGISRISRSCATSVLSDLVTHLASSLSSAELATWLKAPVPVNSDDHAIKNLTIESVNSESCLGSRRILDKAEAARLHLDTVQAHDQVDYLATGREELEELALQRVERQIADIQCCRGL